MNVDVLVIGAGAAGMAAAIRSFDGGASVLVVDRDEYPGGILRQCIHTGFGIDYFREELTGPEYLHRLWTSLRIRNIPIWLETTVLHLSEAGKATLVSPNRGVLEVGAKAVVLATGSYERTRENLRIAGGRPAGVFTAGQAQQLINLYGLRIGNRAVVQGTGDIGLIITRRLNLEGYEVASVLERLPAVVGLRRNRSQCLDDFDIIPHFSQTIVEIHGQSRVEGVTVQALDWQNGGELVPGSNRYIPCDTVVLSAGLIPNRELIDDAPVAHVEANLRLSGTSIFIAGNALEVHDLADGASMQGEKAASNARELIRKENIDRVGESYQRGQFTSRWSVRLEDEDGFEPTRSVVCIVCPRGCVLTDDDYGCKRGKEFLLQERRRKLRRLTSTVWSSDTGSLRRIAVKSIQPVPLDHHRHYLLQIKSDQESDIDVEKTDISFPDVQGY